MSPVAGTRTASQKFRQRASHAQLLQDRSNAFLPALRSRPDRLDAIIVPASRTVASFIGLIDLSVRIGAALVVLCSLDTKVDQVAERVARTPGARALIIRVPSAHPLIPTATSSSAFRDANAQRRTDLSLKRNLGLVLARLHGWSKIAFVDDDILRPRRDDFRRLALQLETHQIAGMICRDYPDNSVVCHARRVAGLAQDNFITGAVLGVRCNDLPLPFFPDIYNEDWFFFSKQAINRTLPAVGFATQAEYDPFTSLQRAEQEEFGDLLAEGLYAFIEGAGPTGRPDDVIRDAADHQFWSNFIDARAETLDETAQELECVAARDSQDGKPYKAIDSVKASRKQLEIIKPELCVAFVDSWLDDMAQWEKEINKIDVVSRTNEAMDFIGATEWRMARFGDPDVGTAHSRVLLGK